MNEKKVKKLGWDEYFKKEMSIVADKVEKYISDNDIKIDAVVPLLRGGNVLATYLAYRFNILKIVPLQYKYFFEGESAELKQVQGIDKEVLKNISKPTFLLVEGNHCYGTSASYAAKYIKDSFPNSKVIYVASNVDFNYKDVVKDADITFFGNYNNDCEELSKEQCEELGIEFGECIIFPWESSEEELTTISLKQYPFKDVKETKDNSKLCQKFDLSEFFKKDE